jgi:uncharacterized protein (TIGR02246 family)
MEIFMSQKFSLEERVQRIEDIEAIKQLKATYARHLDNGYDPDGIASLFTEDGLWVIKGVGGEAKGAAGIKQHCRNLKEGIAWGQHNISSPIVTLSDDGQGAEATFYLVCLLTMAESPQQPEKEAFVLAGKYSDKLVKVGDRWFFAEMTGTIDQSSPWTEGWVKSPFVKESW